MRVNIELEVWKRDVANKLEIMIKDWESRMPQDEDDTLYSLALRRALDVVLGKDVDLGPSSRTSSF
jgi:hypothetical protein